MTPLAATVLNFCDRFYTRLPLRADRYDGRFLFALAGVLAFTLLAYWSLTDYWDVQWYAGEDGASEWWSVATYLASALMAVGAGWLLKRLGHPRLGWVHLIFALALVVAALEEISWGQRLFGWATPESLSQVNEQGETTVHNIHGLGWIVPTLLFWGSTIALLGAVARSVLHHHRRVTTADFILPSLVLSPALLMIMFWIAGAQALPGNLARVILTHLGLDPMGSEIPEVLIGLCLVQYTYANYRRAASLPARETTPGTGSPEGRRLPLPRIP